jgi:hypothetical protein
MVSNNVLDGPRASKGSNLSTERNLIFLYVALILLEGPIRKWLVPSSIGSLVAISRDPIALLLIFQAFRKNLFKPSWLCHSWIILVLLMGVGGVLAMFSNDLPIQIWVFGLRTNLLHLPLILIIPRCLNGNDLDKLLRMLLLLSLPMAILMLIQYRSPIDSWINASAQEGIKQIRGLTGVVRPPGLFTFITGAVEYFALINGIFLGWFLDKSRRVQLIAYGIVSTIIAYSVSGSRLMAGSIAVVWIGTLAVSFLFRPRLPSTKIIFSGLAIATLLALTVAATPLAATFQEGWSRTGKRFEQANKEDGGVGARLQQTLHIPEDIIWRAPMFGHGLGLGTNYGSKLASGSLGFALSESELQRILLESGFVIGIFFMIFRNILVLYTALVARKALSIGSHLPFSLFFVSVLNLSFGQFRLPTSMGFLVISMGFSLTAARLSHSKYAARSSLS